MLSGLQKSRFLSREPESFNRQADQRRIVGQGEPLAFRERLFFFLSEIVANSSSAVYCHHRIMMQEGEGISNGVACSLIAPVS